MNRFEQSKEIYAKHGIDVETALNKAHGKAISVHCWQGDDVKGFENSLNELSGGIQVTGNYPGRARNFEELKSDFLKAANLSPGKKRINLHASYLICDTEDEKIDRDSIEYKHFAPWVKFAKDNNFGIDFNPTCFSHHMVKNGLTLSSPDENVRDFWIKHCKACRKIAQKISEELKQPVLNNIWIPDGFKDVPTQRLSPRVHLKNSLDEIFSEKYDGVIDSVESKVFGIGLESYTVGSNEFYLNYANSRENVYVLLDNGHFHPTENVADKISSLLCFFDIVPLHVTRSVRWDSDHVVLFNDELVEIMKEIVRNDALDKVLIGLDFFDASINRVAAWVIGIRNAQKALLYAMLQPHSQLEKLQESGNFTKKLAYLDSCNNLPFSDIWNEYCKRNNVPLDEEWYEIVKSYEDEVMLKREN